MSLCKETVMINNSTNINKTTITTTYGVGNPVPALKQAQKCGWVKPANGITTLPLDK